MQSWFRSKALGQHHATIIDLDQASEIHTYRPPKHRRITLIVKWTLTALLLCIITFFTFFGIDFNTHITVKHSSIRYNAGTLSPTCFSLSYPTTTIKHGIIPSIPLIEDDVCFDFASTLLTGPINTTTLYHTFWSGGKKMTELELASVRSFIATQSSMLYLWTSTPQEQSFLKEQLQHNSRIEIKVITDDDMMQETSTSWQQQQQQQMLLLRLTSLYKYGGVWFDLNTLFIRNMSPLLTQEWTSVSHCSKQSEIDGSLMHFFKQSPYLCEMLYELKINPLTANKLYNRIYHRLIYHKLTTWSILPWCFTDPSQCKKSNALQNIFSASASTLYQIKLNKVFTFHVQQKKLWSFFGLSSKEGSMFNYLVNQHEQLIGW